MKGWMNEWMDEWMNVWNNRWIDEWMNGCTRRKEWMNIYFTFIYVHILAQFILTTLPSVHTVLRTRMVIFFRPLDPDRYFWKIPDLKCDFFLSRIWNVASGLFQPLHPDNDFEISGSKCDFSRLNPDLKWFFFKVGSEIIADVFSLWTRIVIFEVSGSKCFFFRNRIMIF